MTFNDNIQLSFTTNLLIIVVICCCCTSNLRNNHHDVLAFTPTGHFPISVIHNNQQQQQQYVSIFPKLNKPHTSSEKSSLSLSSAAASTDTITTTNDNNNNNNNNKSLMDYKMEIVQLGAMLDRGQAYNPTSGEYYKDRMDICTEKINDFVQKYSSSSLGKKSTINDIQGEWELILSTVSHGIFRSSPFFLAIQESYEQYSTEKMSFGMNKAELFFKLHELQTCSWGISKIGRVAQYIKTSDSNDSHDSNNKDKDKDVGNYLYSEFDTSIFSLTVIPILGWFKLLPTFGGCVITAAKIDNYDTETGKLSMIVDYTTARPVTGLSGLGDWIWNIKVPVGWIWKNLLPWNNGRDATCSVFIRYVDSNFRIVQDVSGDYFVYTRPIIPRPLDLYT